MTSNQQRGAITLLLVSILLVGVLIVSLGSFKTTYYQIKRAQNEVQARKDHWQAEGGLECTFSYLRETGKQVSDIVGPSSQPLEFIDWCSPYDQQPKITTRNGTVSGSHVVEAALDRYRVTKALRDSFSLGAGAIQSTGPIEVIGTLTLQPTAKETPINGNEHECISISFGDLFTYQYDSTHGDSGQVLGLEVKDPSVDGPFSGFDGVCHPDYKTEIAKGATGTTYSIYAPDYYQKNNPAPFKKDFNPNPTLDPFYSFFGIPKTEQNILKLSQDSDKFRQIQLLNPTDCGSEIMNHFTAGQTKGLWIEGNCHINASVAANLNAAQLLVIHDGAFALNGAMTYNGVIYHLVDYADSTTQSRIDDFWESVTTSSTPSAFTPFVKSLNDPTVEKKTVGIQFASGLPAGGLIFDVKGGVSTIVGDMDLYYRSSANPTDPPSIYQWKKGSWNDF
ncbi:type II secretion system protein [Vibrio fortis]|uniref:type II secretion system protein n=1 Tax=Vibrio fortis TaxID=212667 RepID=UPI0036F3CAF6